LEEANKTVARELIEVLNTEELNRAEQFIGPNFVEHGDTPGDQGGPELLKQQFSMVRSAFPDLHIEIEDEIARGDKVVHRYTVRGTHEGHLMGIPPTSQRIQTSSIHIVRKEGGKISEHWGSIDLGQIKRQLDAG
jgi:predicted ester cyclase